MVTAVETRPGVDPDRASFTTALETARSELTAARGIHPDEPADLLGVASREILATLLPQRRARFSARKVKCATSRYLNREDGRPAAATPIIAITIAMHTPPIDGRRPCTRARQAPRWPSRRRPRRGRVDGTRLSARRRAQDRYSPRDSVIGDRFRGRRTAIEVAAV